MSKRAAAPTSAAPPLPPGPQPTPDQQAVINAAWQTYYVSRITESCYGSDNAVLIPYIFWD
jgi:hypothetical protein